MLRVLTAGESHGPELVAIMEGLPAGVPVSRAAIQADLARRKLGYGRGSRMKFEEDELAISGGVRHGVSLGSPIALRIGNTEWPKWVEVMSPDPVDLDRHVPRPRRRPHPPAPRPRRPRRHAEVRLRRGPPDPRARQRPRDRRPRRARRASRARSSPSSASAWSATRSSIGPVRVPEDAALPLPTTSTRLDADPLRCFDAATSARMVAEVDAARKDGDTLGGVVEVLAYGLPPGLGSHVHWDRRLDAQLAAGAHEHPGDQGRRGRRRLPHHHAPRLRRRTTSSSPADDGIARVERPRRRHRGRHVHGHRAARPRRA